MLGSIVEKKGKKPSKDIKKLELSKNTPKGFPIFDTNKTPIQNGVKLPPVEKKFIKKDILSPSTPADMIKNMIKDNKISSSSLDSNPNKNYIPFSNKEPEGTLDELSMQEKQQNDALLAGMSEEEIQAAISEVKSYLSPSSLEFLMNGKKDEETEQKEEKLNLEGLTEQEKQQNEALIAGMSEEEIQAAIGEVKSFLSPSSLEFLMKGKKVEESEEIEEKIDHEGLTEQEKKQNEALLAGMSQEEIQAAISEVKSFLSPSSLEFLMKGKNSKESEIKKLDQKEIKKIEIKEENKKLVDKIEEKKEENDEEIYDLEGKKIIKFNKIINTLNQNLEKLFKNLNITEDIFQTSSENINFSSFLTDISHLILSNFYNLNLFSLVHDSEDGEEKEENIIINDYINRNYMSIGDMSEGYEEDRLGYDYIFESDEEEEDLEREEEERKEQNKLVNREELLKSRKSSTENNQNFVKIKKKNKNIDYTLNSASTSHTITEILDMHRSEFSQQLVLASRMLAGVLLRRELICSLETYYLLILSAEEKSSEIKFLSTSSNHYSFMKQDWWPLAVSLSSKYKLVFERLIYFISNVFKTIPQLEFLCLKKFEDNKVSEKADKVQETFIASPSLNYLVYQIISSSLLQLCCSQLPTELPTLILWLSTHKHSDLTANLIKLLTLKSYLESPVEEFFAQLLQENDFSIGKREMEPVSSNNFSSLLSSTSSLSSTSTLPCYLNPHQRRDDFRSYEEQINDSINQLSHFVNDKFDEEEDDEDEVTEIDKKNQRKKNMEKNLENLIFKMSHLNTKDEYAMMCRFDRISSLFSDINMLNILKSYITIALEMLLNDIERCYHKSPKEKSTGKVSQLISIILPISSRGICQLAQVAIQILLFITRNSSSLQLNSSIFEYIFLPILERISNHAAFRLDYSLNFDFKSLNRPVNKASILDNLSILYEGILKCLQNVFVKCNFLDIFNKIKQKNSNLTEFSFILLKIENFIGFFNHSQPFIYLNYLRIISKLCESTYLISECDDDNFFFNLIEDKVKDLKISTYNSVEEEENLDQKEEEFSNSVGIGEINVGVKLDEGLDDRGLKTRLDFYTKQIFQSYFEKIFHIFNSFKEIKDLSLINDSTLNYLDTIISHALSYFSSTFNHLDNLKKKFLILILKNDQKFINIEDNNEKKLILEVLTTEINHKILNFSILFHLNLINFFDFINFYTSTYSKSQFLMNNLIKFFSFIIPYSNSYTKTLLLNNKDSLLNSFIYTFSHYSRLKNDSELNFFTPKFSNFVSNFTIQIDNLDPSLFSVYKLLSQNTRASLIKIQEIINNVNIISLTSNEFYYNKLIFLLENNDYIKIKDINSSKNECIEDTSSKSNYIQNTIKISKDFSNKLFKFNQLSSINNGIFHWKQNYDKQIDLFFELFLLISRTKINECSLNFNSNEIQRIDKLLFHLIFQFMSSLQQNMAHLKYTLFFTFLQVFIQNYQLIKEDSEISGGNGNVENSYLIKDRDIHSLLSLLSTILPGIQANQSSLTLSIEKIEKNLPQLLINNLDSLFLLYVPKYGVYHKLRQIMIISEILINYYKKNENDLQVFNGDLINFDYNKNEIDRDYPLEVENAQEKLKVEIFNKLMESSSRSNRIKKSNKTLTENTLLNEIFSYIPRGNINFSKKLNNKLIKKLNFFNNYLQNSLNLTNFLLFYFNDSIFFDIFSLLRGENLSIWGDSISYYEKNYDFLSSIFFKNKFLIEGCTSTSPNFTISSDLETSKIYSLTIIENLTRALFHCLKLTTVQQSLKWKSKEDLHIEQLLHNYQEDFVPMEYQDGPLPSFAETLIDLSSWIIYHLSLFVDDTNSKRRIDVVKVDPKHIQDSLNQLVLEEQGTILIKKNRTSLSFKYNLVLNNFKQINIEKNIKKNVKNDEKINTFLSTLLDSNLNMILSHTNLHIWMINILINFNFLWYSSSINYCLRNLNDLNLSHLLFDQEFFNFVIEDSRKNNEENPSENKKMFLYYCFKYSMKFTQKLILNEDIVRGNMFYEILSSSRNIDLNEDDYDILMKLILKERQNKDNLIELETEIEEIEESIDLKYYVILNYINYIRRVLFSSISLQFDENSKKNYLVLNSYETKILKRWLTEAFRENSTYENSNCRLILCLLLLSPPPLLSSSSFLESYDNLLDIRLGPSSFVNDFPINK